MELWKITKHQDLRNCDVNKSTSVYKMYFNVSLSQPQKTFEMEVNVSGTEFVALENIKTVDTHAVILKV